MIQRIRALLGVVEPDANMWTYFGGRSGSHTRIKYVGVQCRIQRSSDTFVHRYGFNAVVPRVINTQYENKNMSIHFILD